MNILLVFVLTLTVVLAVGAREFHQYVLKLEVSKAGQCSVCTGSFISKKWILTTAHCVYGMDSVIAYIGSPYKRNCSIGHEIGKNSIVIHENFREVGHSVYHYDIALIKFTRKTSCGLIEPIRFLSEKPRKEINNPVNDVVSIVRFSSSCGQSPPTLSWHPVIRANRCRTKSIWSVFEGPIKDEAWCVTTYDEHESCDGDTSTHLTSPIGGDTLIGILTNPSEIDCRSHKILTNITFTDVYQFKSWVINKMKTVNFSSKRSMVKLNIIKERQYSVCSGSFVNPNWILTAAHCVHDANSVVVDVGSHFNSSCPMSYAINTSEIIIHPYFNMKYNFRHVLTKRSHDIALIKFTQETSCKRYWIARLPSENVQRRFYYNSSLPFNHFLKCFNCNTSSLKLRTKLLRIVDSDRCKRRSERREGEEEEEKSIIEAREPMDEDQMCIFTGTTKRSCFADAGGHLFNKKTAELIGIMSRQPDQQCSVVDEVIFTRVSYYVRWIKSHFTGIE